MYLNGTTDGVFLSGFLAGFAGTMLSPVAGSARGYYAKIAANAFVAGTVSQITGGKFANGAWSGAFRFMFNEAMHKLTFAYMHYKYVLGRGEDVYVKASSVDLSKVHASDFKNIGDTESIQLFYHGNEFTNSNDALVYGGLTVAYAGEINGNYYVAIMPDRYDFEMHNWNSFGESFRNIATLFARVVHFDPFGLNKGNMIYFEGLAKISL